MKTYRSLFVSCLWGLALAAGSIAAAEPVPEPIAEPSVALSHAGEQSERALRAAIALSVATHPELDAAHGLLPELFERTSGAATQQSGLYDFSLTTRGFAGALDRRVKVLIDGRDPSWALFGTTDWAAIQTPIDDLEQAELQLGPGSARHGANAAGGVLRLVTRRPQDGLGGRFRLSGGERSTVNLDVRAAARLGQRWFVKFLGGLRQSDGFAVSRRGAAEYSVPCLEAGQTDCLPQERAELSGREVSLFGGSARLDRVSALGTELVLETGLDNVEGQVLLSDLGRLGIDDASTAWSRLRFSSLHWHATAATQKRDSDRQTALATGDRLASEETSWRLETLTRWSFAGGRARVSGGAAREDQRTDSAHAEGRLRPFLLDRSNRQTLLSERARIEADAVFAQLDWELSERATLLVGARWDDSTLFEPQLSPRLSLVFAVRPEHLLRLSYQQGFEAPSIEESFLRFELEPSINLAHLEGLCAVDGVPCGFDLDLLPGENPATDTTADTRVLAVGNRDLEVEEVRSWELGYDGRLGRRARLRLGLHSSHHEDFIVGLLPQLGTALGRVNPAFAPYAPPRALSPEQQAKLLSGLALALGPRLDYLTTDVDGTPIVVLSSYANLGEADVTGADVELRWELSGGFWWALSYAWLDVDLDTGAVGLERWLGPNAPENRGSFELGFNRGRWDARLSYRWLDDFRWVSAPFVGDVEAFELVDLAVGLRLAERWSLGAHVANLLDEETFETFGGDLLRRRALLSLGLSW